MKRFVGLLFVLFFVSALSIAQRIISEAPMFVENGTLKSTRITVAFNQNVISTESGVALVDTLRHPIRNAGIRDLLRQLSLRYGPFTIRKISPRSVWGDTLATSKRTGRITRVPDLSQSFGIDFALPVPIDSVIGLFRAIHVVRYADQPVSIGLAADEIFGWNLQTINAAAAWTITTGSPSIRLALIDDPGTLSLVSHEDLQGKFISGFGLEGGSHSFYVCGVAGAATNNGIGIASLGYDVSLIDYHFNVFGQSGSFLASRIDQAVSDGADVINCSWLTLRYQNGQWCPGYFHVVSEAIQAAIRSGVVVVAACGNNPLSSYPNCNLSTPYEANPADEDGVIAVSGTDENDQFVDGDDWNYSNVSVVAPGTNIWTTHYSPPWYVQVSGTSFSTPHVAALAALILSVNPNLEPETVRAYICRTADKVDASRYPYTNPGPYGYQSSRLGYGRINAYKALSMANGVPAPPQNVQISTVAGQWGYRYPKVSWSANGEPDIAGYELWRRITGSDCGAHDWSLLASNLGTSPTEYTDWSVGTAGLGNQCTAEYKLRAKDAVNYLSDFSATVSIAFGNLNFKIRTQDPGAANKEIPAVFALHRVFPNPFNPSTEIKFDLPEDGFVSLSVYDVLGRKTADLLNDFRKAGYHSTTWNANNAASGVYFARFTVVNEFGRVQYMKMNKLVLMK